MAACSPFLFSFDAIFSNLHTQKKKMTTTYAMRPVVAVLDVVRAGHRILQLQPLRRASRSSQPLGASSEPGKKVVFQLERTGLSSASEEQRAAAVLAVKKTAQAAFDSGEDITEQGDYLFISFSRLFFFFFFFVFFFC
jgi:hypothetical protein